MLRYAFRCSAAMGDCRRHLQWFGAVRCGVYRLMFMVFRYNGSKQDSELGDVGVGGQVEDCGYGHSGDPMARTARCVVDV